MYCGIQILSLSISVDQFSVCAWGNRETSHEKMC